MGQDTRSIIIEVSYKLFLAQGYKITTTKQVAELAGVNESTIFRTFGNKENLFHQSIAYYTADIMRIDNDGLTYGRNLEQDIYLLIKKNIELMKKTFPSFRLLVKVSLIDDQILSEIDNKIRNLQNYFKQYLIGMQRRGLIKEIDLEAFVEYIFGVVFHESVILNEKEADHTEYQTILDEFCKKYARFCFNLLNRHD